MIKNKILYSSLVLAGVLSLSGCSAMLPYEDNFKCEKGIDSGVCASVNDVYELSDDMDKLRTINASGENIPQKPTKEIAISNIDSNNLRNIANSISIKQIQNGKPVVFKIKETTLAKNYYAGSDHKYIVPHNQEVVEYLLKDKEAYKRRLNNESNDAFKDYLYKKDSNSASIRNRSTISNNLSNDNLSNGSSFNDSNQLKNNQNDLLAFLNESDNKRAYGVSKKTNNSNALNSTNKFNNSSNSNNSNDLNGFNHSSNANLNNPHCQSGDMQIKYINSNVKVCVYQANIREKPSCRANILGIANKGEVMFAEYEQGGWVKLNNGTFIHRSIVTIEK